MSGESINSAGTVMSTGFLAPTDITASFISSSSSSLMVSKRLRALLSAVFGWNCVVCYLATECGKLRRFRVKLTDHACAHRTGLEEMDELMSSDDDDDDEAPSTSSRETAAAIATMTTRREAAESEEGSR